MQTQFKDNGCWSGDESVSEIMLDFASGESLCTSSSEILTLEAVEPPEDQLDNALELNRHLHASLQRKQEEISALKEKNAQLKELAEQAERFATILDVLIPQPVKNCVSRPASAHTPLTHCSSAEPPEWHFTASEDSWLPSVPINTQKRARIHMHGAKRQLWPTDHEHFSRGSNHEPFSRTSDHEPNSRTSDHEPFSRGSNHEPFSRTSDHEPYSRGSDHEPFLRTSDHEPFSRSSDHEPYSRTSDHEPFSRTSDHEPFSRTSDHEPFSRSSENSLFSRHSDCEPYARTSNQEPFSRGSENDPLSGSSDHDPYSRRSNEEPYPKSSDHEPYSSCSENNPFSGSSDHEPFSGCSDHEPFSRGSENDPFSSCSENDSFSGSFGHDPYSRNSDHGPCNKRSDHDPYSHGQSRSSGENSVNHFVGESAQKVIRDPKRLKLDLDLLQLSSKQLSSDLEQSDQVPPKSAKDSHSHKANLPRLLNAEMIQVYGAFHGLKVVVAKRSVTSDLSDKGEEKAMCFKTSVRDHSTVRTNVFPHGKTFTSLTPDGCCRFLWVPNQN